MSTPSGAGTPGISRRHVLIGAGALVAVLGAAGFTIYEAIRPSGPSGAADAGRTTPPAGPATGTVLAQVAQIPVNGGIILTDAKVVLTRATGTTVKAFTAVCTHQNCLVGTVAAGVIRCPCHGSAFDATTGAVVTGPATRPLAAVPITVSNGNVTAD